MNYSFSFFCLTADWVIFIIDSELFSWEIDLLFDSVLADDEAEEYGPLEFVVEENRAKESCSFLLIARSY